MLYNQTQHVVESTENYFYCSFNHHLTSSISFSRFAPSQIYHVSHLKAWMTPSSCRLNILLISSQVRTVQMMNHQPNQLTFFISSNFYSHKSALKTSKDPFRSSNKIFANFWTNTGNRQFYDSWNFLKSQIWRFSSIIMLLANHR